MDEIIVTRMDKIRPIHHNEHEKYEYYRHDVTKREYKYEAASPKEGNQTVVAFYTIPPGKSNYPFHYHTANEEVFYIISGCGILETPNGTRPVTAGDIIVCPVGQGGAHKITNSSSEADLTYLDVDTNNTPDIAFYPHTNKAGIRAVGGIRANFNLDSKVDYYDSEL